MKRFRLSLEAAQDITEIFDHVAEDSFAAAERIRTEIYGAIRSFAKSLGMGHKREDLTNQELRFWPIFSYLVIYRPNTKPLEIVAVLHGRRNLKKLLKKR